MLQNTAAVTRLQREGWSTDPEEARQQFEEHLREIGFRRPEPDAKKRKRVVKLLPPATCWEEEFARMLPGRPLCAPDHFSLGVYPARRELAITFPHLQFNRTTLYRWLVLDIDRKSAAVAWRAAGLPPPNFTMTNPANGHAHVAWLLAVPVRGGDPAAASFRFLAMIESAYQRRLGADAAFCMHGQVKNPLHSDWETLRIFNTFRFANAAYSLRELAAPLRQMRRDPRKSGRAKQASNMMPVSDAIARFSTSCVFLLTTSWRISNCSEIRAAL